MAAAMAITPLRASNSQTKPMRRMFSSRSSLLKPSPFDRWVRTTSPSSTSTRAPNWRSCNSSSREMVLLPAPLMPVNHNVKPLCISFGSASAREIKMMFSTKAEYGVRVMVELARRAGDEPIPLAEIAAHDGLPLAYLEHLVARLRKAGLVDSRRGSRGGYLLARPAGEITMVEVVEALEGAIAPIECISQSADGSIVCSRESDPDHACPTKLLWTRVGFAM